MEAAQGVDEVAWQDNDQRRSVLVGGVMNLGMGALVTSIAPTLAVVNPQLYATQDPAFSAAMVCLSAIGLALFSAAARAVALATRKAPRRFALAHGALLLDGPAGRRSIDLAKVATAKRSGVMLFAPTTVFVMGNGSVEKVPCFFAGDAEGLRKRAGSSADAQAGAAKVAIDRGGL